MWFKSLAQWFAPSLTRRVLLALLLAFALIWLVLVVRDYREAMSVQARHKTLLRQANMFAGVLDGVDEDQAVQALRTVEALMNAARRDATNSVIAYPGDIRILMLAPDGARIYASPGMERADLLIRNVDLGHGVIRLEGREYWAAERVYPKFRLVVFEPVIPDEDALSFLFRQYVTPLAIAFPLILLPLWLAVSRGLRPLRTLSAYLHSRDKTDFSPLSLPAPYRELKPVVQALDELLRRSRDSIARERAIVQDAAHEMRTPLAVISTQAHALASENDAEARQQNLAALEQAVARHSHLVQQLLRLAALEGGEEERRQPVDLVEVTRNALIGLSPRAEAQGMELELDSSDGLPASLALVSFLSIVDNLLSNAVAYGRVGGRVRVRLAAAEGWVELAVADDGPGIAVEDRPHLFERFYRGKTASAPGSGLGLAIVWQAVQAQGGHIRIEEGLDGRGVAFHVSLPLLSLSD
ncbi:sensor histidine kinase KdpD [Chromobacterium sp. IIBBL 290-4]|uniref:sensor histidine kinase n=1 Tax=Chromobacterium sp. IIBBL 290-4 TaxID=2953890 RepID=UPI0020B6CA7E|nr:ATP-binding protein [Chromobacterium sp. IIBBL 290-4]UTH76304.1 ATP-binding protein [Chromobacterium sp. IIBBL 290-4]